MPKESEIILRKIESLKYQYRQNTNNLLEDQARRLKYLEETIRELRYKFELALLAERKALEMLIDEAEGEERERLQTKLKMLIEEQQIKRENQEAIWERDIKNLKENFRLEKVVLDEEYMVDLRALEQALRDALQREKEEEEEKKKKVPPGLLVERIPYPRWWRDSLNAKIDLTAPGSKTLATVTGKLHLWVATIVLTVTGETVITITFGKAGSSGPIYLGGDQQPMGIVIAMGNSPAPCADGNLVISATDPTAVNPQIGGWATCFAEEYKKEVKP